IVDQSKLAAKYNQVIDSPSAYEMLTAKLEEAAAKPVIQTGKAAKPEETTIEKVVNNTVVKSIMRTAGNTIVRSLLGSLGLGGRSRSSSKSWF
ncbi:MAG: helicase HerA-like domain-containing protein, partial [Ginsengibacter sp.]